MDDHRPVGDPARRLFELQHLVFDSRQSTTAVRNAIDYQPFFTALVGAYENDVSTALSLVTMGNGVPHVSYGASSPALAERLQYPFFARTVFNDVERITGVLRVAREFGWRRMASTVRGALHAPHSRGTVFLTSNNVSGGARWRVVDSARVPCSGEREHGQSQLPTHAAERRCRARH